MTINNHTLAFLLVCAAGGSTCIGAAVVFHPTYIRFANKKTLGAALGLSAGVMLYVSFIEIFTKSQAAFEDSGFSEANSYLFATLCFFFGFVLMLVLNKIVHLLDPDDIGHQDIDFDMIDALEKTIHADDQPTDVSHLVPTDMDEEAAGITLGSPDADTHTHTHANTVVQHQGHKQEANLSSSDSCSVEETRSHKGSPEDEDSVSSMDEKRTEAKQKLERMGLVTALAIGIHNFPEGLATFVATLDDPAVGVALTVAIAIHNIPEGVCVAMPIFFATGDRHKAFIWAVVSGVSEVVAAGLGWIVLSHLLGDMVYAILFGCVSGMMVNICAYQLIPTAHKYDPQDTVASHSVLAGMMIMAVSLVVFLY